MEKLGVDGKDYSELIRLKGAHTIIRDSHGLITEFRSFYQGKQEVTKIESIKKKNPSRSKRRVN